MKNAENLKRGVYYDIRLEDVKENKTTVSGTESTGEGQWKLGKQEETSEEVYLNLPEPVSEEEPHVYLNMAPGYNVSEKVQFSTDMQHHEPIANSALRTCNSGHQNPYVGYPTYSEDRLTEGDKVLIEMMKQTVDSAGYIAEQAKSLKARERKRIVGYKATASPDGRIWIHKYFDDGSVNTEPLTENVHGPIAVYLVKKYGKSLPHGFVICFKGSGIWVTGKMTRLNADSLYKSFIEAGVSFNCKYSPAQIGQALYELFAFRIKNTEDVITLEELGGWYQGRYLHCENFPFKEDQTFGELPVFQKKLSQMPLTEDVVRAYTQEIQSITDSQNRIILSLYTYISIIASLLESAGKKNQTVVNVVPYEKIPLKRLGIWLLATEKIQLAPINADVSKSTLTKICSSIQDEVLFMDFRMSALETDHKKNKIEKNHAKVIETFLGNYSLNINMHPMGVVTISNGLYPGNNVCNILLGRDSLKETNTNPDVMRCVYANFIRFVEDNFQKVETALAKRRESYYTACIAFECVLEVVNMFWKEHGYSFAKIIGTNIGRNDFAKILQSRIFDEEDLLQTFVKAIRSEAKNIKFVKKNEKTQLNEVVRFNDEWLWIPSALFEKTCRAQGLEEYIDKILYLLKKEGILKTDSDGRTRKLQIAGDRTEYYQLARSAFEKVGQAPLMSLGKQ